VATSLILTVDTTIINAGCAAIPSRSQASLTNDPATDTFRKMSERDVINPGATLTDPEAPARVAASSDHPYMTWVPVVGVRFIVECDYYSGRCLEIDGGLTM
jgi:hypothetical protein